MAKPKEAKIVWEGYSSRKQDNVLYFFSKNPNINSNLGENCLKDNLRPNCAENRGKTVFLDIFGIFANMAAIWEKKPKNMIFWIFSISCKIFVKILKLNMMPCELLVVTRSRIHQSWTFFGFLIWNYCGGLSSIAVPLGHK